MAVVQQSLAELIQAEQVTVTNQLIELLGPNRIHYNTGAQLSAAAVTGGAVVPVSEDLLQRLVDLNTQMAIALDLFVDA